MTCKHTNTKLISTRGFMGPVSNNQNPAAHGGVCYTYECLDCGSQLDCNVNQNFIEEGSWGPSLAERNLQKSKLIKQAKELASTIPTLTYRNKERVVNVRVDESNGEVVIEGSLHNDKDVNLIWTSVFVDNPDWVRKVQEVRKLFLEAEGI
jgi:hypothetical protein